MIDVLVTGHFCVDLIPTIPPASAASASFLAPGRLAETGELVLALGGSVSNTGVSLYRLGMNVRLVARLGDDLIANLTRDILRTHGQGLDENLIVTHGEPSSYTIVINPPGIDRTFLHCPGANHTFGPEDVSDELLDQARLLHLGYPPVLRRMYEQGGAALAELYRRAKAHGLTTSLDLSMPDPATPSGRADWPAILGRALPDVDVFLPSAEELMYMLWRDHYDELIRRAGPAGMIDALTPDEIARLAEMALAAGAKIVGLKLGHRGLYLRTAPALGDMGRGGPADPAAWAGRELWSPPFCVEVVGTVGAGDATIAGFLAALLRGQGPEEAVTTATAVGGCDVEAADATSGVRSWEETQARIGAAWPRRDAQIDAPGWTPDARTGLWHGPDDRG